MSDWSAELEFLAKVESGGTGWVFRAADLQRDREVAVKVMFPRAGHGAGRAAGRGRRGHPPARPVSACQREAALAGDAVALRLDAGRIILADHMQRPDVKNDHAGDHEPLR